MMIGRASSAVSPGTLHLPTNTYHPAQNATPAMDKPSAPLLEQQRRQLGLMIDRQREIHFRLKHATQRLESQLVGSASEGVPDAPLKGGNEVGPVDYLLKAMEELQDSIFSSITTLDRLL